MNKATLLLNLQDIATIPIANIMIKVFHIISHFDVGGAERVALNIAHSASPDIEYHVVELLRAHGPFTARFLSELRQHDITYHRGMVPDVHFHYLFERLAALTFPLWFIFLFLRHRPQVIHTHTEMPDLGVYTFFRLFPWLLKRCRVVRTIHNTRLWTGMQATGRRVEAFFQQHHCNVAISESTRQCYQKVYGEQPPIIYNGVEQVAQKPYAGLAKDKTNILFAGRYSAQKGITVLVEVIKRLAHNSRYRFYLFGSGEEQTLVERELSGLPTVTLSGPLYGISAYLGSFDYLFMPSLFEGLPLMAIEAGMAATPTIINDAPGLRETLPKNWCLKVENNSIDHYLQLFTKLMPTADSHALGREAQCFAEQRFGLRQMQTAYEARYHLLVSNLKA